MGGVEAAVGEGEAMIDEVRYTDEEAAEAWRWVHAHGPRNTWTATYGTAARMIGRLLKERERLVGMLRQIHNAKDQRQR